MITPLTWHQTRAAESRRTILDAAEAMFLEQGYKCSVDAICERAGVSRRTVYLHFGSKEQLFRAMIDDLHQRILAPILRILGETGSVYERLEKIARHLAHNILKEHSLKLLRLHISEAAQFSDLGAKYYETGMGTVLATLSSFMQEGMDAGELRRGDARLLAERFMSTLVGYRQYRALLGVATPEVIPAETYVQLAMDVLRGAA